MIKLNEMESIYIFLIEEAKKKIVVKKAKQCGKRMLIRNFKKILNSIRRAHIVSDEN